MKRSLTNRKIAGVCGGIAEALDMNANILRLLVFIVLFTPLALPTVFLYFVLAFLLPAGSRPTHQKKRSNIYYQTTSTRQRRSTLREAEHVGDEE
ncbi:MAG: PspC domain-containing protein [Aerococcus sp.]|nr:PspC domain-containing protein [Aerococcus sp.]